MKHAYTTCTLCPKPATRYGTTCTQHAHNAKGTGKLKCQICHQPQRDHQNGYPEHTHITHTIRTPKTLKGTRVI